MVRTILGGVLALAGAAAAVRSPFRVWYDGRHGTDVRVDDLFTGVGVTPHDAAPLGSLLLPLGFAALLTLLGVLMLSSAVIGLAGVLVGGVTVLWAVRQEQASGSLVPAGLGSGTAWALSAAVLLLAGAAVLRGAARRMDEAGRVSSAPSPVPSRAAEREPDRHPLLPEAIRAPGTPGPVPGTPEPDGLAGMAGHGTARHLAAGPPAEPDLPPSGAPRRW
ncbi:hypothetical protein [Actinacidiphila yeochonensis]|uniref:hypothetical protein n=1 Tax=Actinacidiphila yeochonensis TaxID=89050 RepID=UPI000691AAE7|nr:hypothetical protein [Actinacidiphila yeochonensis]